VHPLTAHALANERIQDRLREAEHRRLLGPCRQRRLTWPLSLIRSVASIGRKAEPQAQGRLCV
jgi:hypothetical protein